MAMKKKSVKSYVACAVAVMCAAAAFAESSPLADDAVLIRVGSREITKKDYSDHIRLMEALYKNRHPKAAKDREKMASASARIRLSATSEIVSRALLHSGLCAEGAAVGEEALAEAEKQYASAFCHKGQTFEDLEDEMDDAGLKEVFARNFRMDAEIESALKAAYSNDLAVTAEDVKAAKERASAYNARATATNELFKARLAEAKARIDAGEDFAALATEYSMAAEDGEGGDIGERILSDFEDDECKLAIAQLREGDTTDIVEDDLGYDIYKAVKVIPKEEAALSQTTWHLARIHFDKPYFFEEQPDDELVEDLVQEKKAVLLKRLTPTLNKASKVEFPHGREALGK